MWQAIRTWNCGKYTLDIYDVDDEKDRTRVGYRFFYDDELIFEGDNYRISVFDKKDDDATIATLLSFLSLRKGDTNKEYFDNYTEKQLAFSEEHGEELSIIIYDQFGEYL